MMYTHIKNIFFIIIIIIITTTVQAALIKYLFSGFLYSSLYCNCCGRFITPFQMCLFS